MAKRRANGEGSIRKRKDGRWEGRYTVGHDPLTGKAISKNVLAKTQAEVTEKLQAAIAEAKKLNLIKTSQHTVDTWIHLWYNTYIKNSIRETTACYYRNYIENHIVPHIGDVPLAKLSTMQIQQMYNDIQQNGRIVKYEGMPKKPLSPRTMRGIHVLLHECLDQAVREKLLSGNPSDGCRVPSKERIEMKTLPAEKIADYLQAAEEWGVLPMFYLELTSGIRRGELVALLWEDVDVPNRTVSINKTAIRVNGEVKINPPKTANSTRKIVLPQTTIDLLVQEHSRHPNNPYLFPSPVTGGMRGPDCTGRIHQKLLKKIGLSGIRFHDLRHTFATLALQNGVDVKTLSSILGHYSAGFTLDTYAHVTDQMRQDAANKMESFMLNMA